MKIKPGDIIIVLLVAAVSVFLLLSAAPDSNQNLYAVITVSGEEAGRIELSGDMEPVEIKLEDIDVVITAQNGKIAFTYSDCPDQTCVHTGWLDSAGDIAVCIPNEVIVKIEGESGSDIDTIAE